MIPERADVIVIGSGGAGLATAVSAAEHGLEVLLLEKEARLGGTTIWSVGSLTAAHTALQRRSGISDDTTEFVEDMIAFRPELLEGDAPDLRLRYAQESGATIDWLIGHGVSFAGPYLEPPHRTPRMHNVIPNSQAYIDRLSKSARRLGVKIVTEARVVSLSTEPSTSLTVESMGVTRTVHAEVGIVLATGDFSANSAMRAEHLTPDAAAALPINPTADGSGHRLAKAAGADLRGMGVTFGPQLRFPEPPTKGFISRLPTWKWLTRIEALIVQRLPPAVLRPFVKSLLITHMSPTSELFEDGAILVNTAGQRFCDEAASVAPLAHQAERKGYIIFDKRIGEKYDGVSAISTAPGIAFARLSDYRKGRPDLYHEASTAAQLAERLGVPAESLTSAVGESELGPDLIALGPVFSMLTVTEGAIRTDSDLRVLDVGGKPIPGLYAAGAAGQGGMLLLGHGHHLGWALSSGRWLGAALARAAVSDLAEGWTATSTNEVFTP